MAAHEMPEKLKIAVVGGSGFIGTRLVRRLVAAEHEVRIADIARSQEFSESWTDCDVRDVNALRTLCQGCDVIYNLAAEHRDDVRPRRLYNEVNVGGAHNTCRVAAAIGVSRIVFTSTVATVRLRTTKTKGCLSRNTALTMVFKLCQSASKEWRRLDGSHHLAEIVRGVKFKDGEKLIERAA